MHKAAFYLQLERCEFRYNHRHQNIYQIILTLVRNQLVFSS